MHHYIIANWKLNHDRDSTIEWLIEFQQKFQSVASVKVGIAPSFTQINLVADFLNNWNLWGKIDLIAQDVSRFAKGRYTGEVAAFQLKRYGVKAAIVGHSERRSNFKESDQDIVEKIQRLCEKEILPIIAVSKLEQVEFLAKAKALEQETIIVYEPIEAIGTGHSADPDNVNKIVEGILKIKESNLLKILYGGSVDAKDVSDYFSCPKLGGFLVGTASVKAREFLKLLEKIG